MWITVFRNRLRTDAAADYGDVASRMKALAQRMPGYIGFKTFSADDGERVSLVEFDSLEALLAWKNHPEHRAAQERGRQAYYSEYSVQSAEIARDYRFSLDPQQPASSAIRSGD
ncbi:MAG: antibiotic biosynthesis monooxygenase [Myxococcales bacterium]|nr:antibiotic biosynthesis monooxygenase [Myxococcales bacterium]